MTLSRLLIHNWQVKVVAFFLAIALWLYTSGQARIERTLQVRVQESSVRSLPADYQVVLEPGQTALIDIVYGAAEGRSECLNLAHKMMDRRIADRVFELAWTHSQVVLRQLNATEADVSRLRLEFGLERPLVEQYLSWVGGLVHLDPGISYVSRAQIG